MSRYFIDRPIFAWVLAIVVMLAGALSITTLSVSQYPQIAPTTVRITLNYPGADAETVENSVTKIIEQGMTGIDHLDYMSSNSTSTGQASISLIFTSSADPDVAQMQVQNKLQLVESRLPQAVQNAGITVSKSTSGFFMIASFVSMDDTLPRLHFRCVAACDFERAGPGSQNSIGIGVMGGMISATVLGVFFIPVLFVLVRRLFKGRTPKTAGETGKAGQLQPAA